MVSAGSEPPSEPSSLHPHPTVLVTGLELDPLGGWNRTCREPLTTVRDVGGPSQGSRVAHRQTRPQ